MLSESHPNYHNQGPTNSSSGSKESLSVYGLFHHLARTSQGKSTLRRYFLCPSMDVSVINERLDTISVILRPENAVALDKISKNLAHIKNLRQVMVQLTKGVASSTNKGGGIARGIWSTIRQVWILLIFVTISTEGRRYVVCVSRIENKGFNRRA